jgi:hydrogenase/urease accessory protein HupE
MQNKNNKSVLLKLNPHKLLLPLGLITLLALSLVKIPAILLAVNSDWSHGFQHPLQGWDHLLTMIAVGIWAAQLRGQAIDAAAHICQRDESRRPCRCRQLCCPQR